ncbi:MAG: RIP metalloprotease RseP [Thermodesulfovibrionales bacterium]|nr:RIP metalloprotease RseP [Thermodesulfovibrionales bacterium]
MTFLSAIILLGIIIFVHEIGHFLSAKLVGVRVLKFSLGFGPKIIGKRYGDTEYLISSIPFGGYVKMLGEHREEVLVEEEKARSYTHQPVWKRFIIVSSGPLFNLLFALVIFVCIFLHGLPVLLPEVGEVLTGSPAERAGVIKGDTIVAIDDSQITQWGEMTKIIHNSPGRSLNLKVKRQTEIMTVPIVPEKRKVKDIFGEEREIGLIGIKPSGNTLKRQEGLIKAIGNAVMRTWEISALTVVAVAKLIQRVIPMETIGGPILILQMAGEQASLGLLNFFIFMAIINVNIGILNLLPIPILDGGHILFLGIEAVRRKPLSDKLITVAQRVGLAIILFIMVFALYNDIMRIITGKPIP